MNGLNKYFEQDQLAKTLGIELVSIEAGRAVARMVVREQHYNTLRIVHGGAVFSLADFAFAAASNSHGTVAVGITAAISYIKATTSGILTANAVEVSRSRRLATYSITVTDSENEVVAAFQGTVYRKEEPLKLPA